jgi:hypothetical protein
MLGAFPYPCYIIPNTLTLNERENKNMGKRGQEDLAREGSPRASSREISMAKRSRPGISRLERACGIIRDERQGVTAAARAVGLPKAQLKQVWGNYCDDESGSVSEDEGAYVSSAKNAKNLVPSESDEDNDD